MLGFDRDTETIRILVVLKDDKMMLLDGRPLPEIREGSIGELLLNEYAVKDGDSVKECQSEVETVMLESGASVFFSMMVHQMSSGLWRTSEQKKVFADGPEGPCAEVRLENVLKLRLRGSKTPSLCACKCKIPCLENQEAISLNHAYTLISSYFETKRISHSGNVFQLGWWYDRRRKRWVQLDELRTILQFQRAGHE